MIKTLCLLTASTYSWSLPGLIPKNYEEGQQLDIMVGQLQSRKSSFTFDYYMLNWCSNNAGKGYDAEKYGTTLTGAPLHESPYWFVFGNDSNNVVCLKSLTHGEVE